MPFFFKIGKFPQLFDSRKPMNWMSQPGNKNDQAKLPDKRFPCGYAQTSEQHRQNLNDIVESHLRNEHEITWASYKIAASGMAT